MQAVLEIFRDNAGEQRDQSALDKYSNILRLLHPINTNEQPNWDQLEIIRPIWYQRLKSRRKRPLLLRDIREEMCAAEDRLRPEIFQQLEDIERLRNTDERISACIIGA